MAEGRPRLIARPRQHTACHFAVTPPETVIRTFLPPMHLKLASYNIRKSVGLDWRRRPERVLGVLNEIGADIVALQEVDRRFGSRLSSIDPAMIDADSPYVPVRSGIRPQSLGFHGNLLLVRKSARVTGSGAIELPYLEPRGAVFADLDFGHTSLRVVGLHLGLMRGWRKRQAEALVGQLDALEARHSTVIMGDLNEWSRKPGVLHAFEASHHIAIPGPSYHASLPLFAFDRIVSTRDVEIVRTGVHRSALAAVTSDHLPVWAEIRLPNR